jgi:hypothetical protein
MFGSHTQQFTQPLMAGTINFLRQSRTRIGRRPTQRLQQLSIQMSDEFAISYLRELGI